MLIMLLTLITTYMQNIIWILLVHNLFVVANVCKYTVRYAVRLPITVRQAAVAAQRTMTFQNPAGRSSGIRNVKFKNLFNTNFSAMWSHEGDDSAIQWCQFCVSLSGSLFNILQLFASFSQNPMLLQWRTVLTTLAICCVMF